MKKHDNLSEDAQLLEKNLTGLATDEEQRDATTLLDEHLVLKKRYKRLKQKGALDEEFQNYDSFDEEKAYKNFLKTLNAKKRRKLRAIWYSVAAVITLIVVTITLKYAYGRLEETTPVLFSEGYKGELLLSKGEKIVANDSDFVITTQGVNVNYKKGVLSYVSTEKETASPDSVVNIHNVFTIPLGGENSVVLSDGTRVKLNAGSKLIYPVKFAAKRRVVRLEGEGYFEVQKDANHPFVVMTEYGDISVLGTSFNVNAYNSRGYCYATLVDGKIRIDIANDKTVEITPGQQCVFNQNQVRTHTVNVANYVSWINGIYTFQEEPLKEILSTLERWYNVEFICEDSVLYNSRYTGEVERYNSVNTFLNAFKMTGDLVYKIEGRKIFLRSDIEK